MITNASQNKITVSMLLYTMVAYMVLMTTVIRADVLDRINDVVADLIPYDDRVGYDILVYNSDMNMIHFTITRKEDGELIFNGDIKNE